jgi:L-2,4-diaminobutyrate decarboxylase
MKIPKYQSMVDRFKPCFPAAQPEAMRQYMRSCRPVMKMGTETTRLAQQVETTIFELFRGVKNWAAPEVMINLMPPTTALSAQAASLSALYNPDLCSPALAGEKISNMEKVIVRVIAGELGYKPDKAFGLFTYGGTMGIQQAMLLGLSRVDPDRYINGQRTGVKVLCSDAAHYSVADSAGRMGLGLRNVVKVATNQHEEMEIDDFIRKGEEILKRGEAIGTVVATMGTTNAFGIDDIGRIKQAITRWEAQYHLPYRINLLADAAIGWAWNFFNNYDFGSNPLQFNAKTVAALSRIVSRMKQIKTADATVVNPHKYGNVPIPASFIIYRDGIKALAQLRRLPGQMPQIAGVKSDDSGAYSLETTRYAGGVAATAANFMLFGRTGYQALLGQITAMGLYFREQLSMIDGISVVNPDACGGATLFRLAGKEDPADYREFVRKTASGSNPVYLSDVMLADGLPAAKSIIMSPFTREADIEKAAAKIAAVNAKLVKS